MKWLDVVSGRALVASASMVAIALVAAACASLQSGPFKPVFGRLEGAVRNDQYDASPTQANVRVVRGDTVMQPSIGMRLNKGDSISTSSATKVMLSFAAGYEVALDTATTIYIENPSIFLTIGKAFIRRLKGGKDTLDAHTPQATLHERGTSYLLSVVPGNTTVRVVDGTIEADARDGSWAGVRYTAGQGGLMRSNTPVVRMADAGRAQLATELRFVTDIERITKIPVPQLDSMTEAQARAALTRAGFSVLLVLHRKTNDHAPGTVVDQSPAAGTTTTPGTYFTLTLAERATTGRGDTARANMCTVPNLRDQKQQTAEALLKRANLRGQGVRESGELDFVNSQTERAGTSVPCGSIVHYKYGRIG